MSKKNYELIKRALTQYKVLAYNHRYGGLMKQYNEACAALEALEVEARPGVQLGLFEPPRTSDTPNTPDTPNTTENYDPPTIRPIK